METLVKKMILFVAIIIMTLSCGKSTTGPSENDPVYFPMAAGDYWLWSYTYSTQNLPTDITEEGTRLWTVDGVVSHSQGFQMFQVTVSDSVVVFDGGSPVDTVFSEIVEYYRVLDSGVSYYYTTEEAPSWLLLDFPLTLGKTWYDVENALYEVMSVDTTLTLPFGVAANCAWVLSSFTHPDPHTFDSWFCMPGVGLVKRVFHQDISGSIYHSEFELTSSSRL
jgi:hypothetical protein